MTTVGSNIVTSGGFPHLYSHDVSGAMVDPQSVRSELEPPIKVEDQAHVVNIAVKRAITVTHFKQMFYARGDNEFAIANSYDCPDIASNILASVWGQRVEWQNAGTTLPYNNWSLLTTSDRTRIVNYNKLSGRPDDPSGTELAYGYNTDLQRNFYAAHEVIGNLERDLCVKREDWTLCSRIAIEDQLQNLCFAPEEPSDDVCMKVSCARRWSEVENALAESCLAENNIIGVGDYVDLYINVRVTNGNPDTKDTIIRIRFTVQIVRGPDDLGNWNVVSRNAADAVITTGMPYDGPEGGNLQYANASQIETDPALTNRERVQQPDTTQPATIDDVTDTADGVGHNVQNN